MYYRSDFAKIEYYWFCN